MNRRLLGPRGAGRREWGLALSSVIGCSSCGADGDFFGATDTGEQARGASSFRVWWGGNAGETEQRQYACSEFPDFSELQAPEEQALKNVLMEFCANNVQASVILERNVDKGKLVEFLGILSNACGGEGCAAAPLVVQGQPDMLAVYAPCGGTAGGLRLLSIPEGAVLEALGPGALAAEGQGDGELVVLDSEGNVKKDPYRWFTRHMSCSLGEFKSVWMLPMGVHHVNRLFYNKDRVKAVFGEEFEARLATTMSLDEWLDAGSKATSSGHAFIAVPNKESDAWVLSMLALENVRIALTKGSNQLSEETLKDPSAVADAVMTRLQEIRELAVSGDSDEVLTAAGALDKVRRGEALFTVMGDWAQVDVKADVAVGMAWFPGTHNVRVYAADGIAAFDREGTGQTSNPQRGFVNAVNESRTEFASEKGATEISQWMDVSLKECASEAGKDTRVSGCYVVPALSLDNGQWVGDRGAALSAWWNYPSAGNAAEAKAALVPVTKKKEAG